MISTVITIHSCNLTRSCIKWPSQKSIEIGPVRRWVIYVIGVLEALLLAGCVFGWAQLVYVLKNEQIFFDLCQHSREMEANLTEVLNREEMILRGCEEQDKAFAFIYTLIGIFYGIPGVVTGMILHYCGLALTRILAATLLTSGFISLGLTDKDHPEYLYIAMIMLSIGANQIRMSGFQLCNLFPKYRSTALTVITGSFAASSGLFLLFQFGQQANYSLKVTGFSLATVAFLSIPATFIMPWHHIPYDSPSERETENGTSKSLIPLKESLLSISAFLQIYWSATILNHLSAYFVYFNVWISRISLTNAEAGHYSLLFGVSNLVSPLFSPLPGLLTDCFSRGRDADTTPEGSYRRRLRSPALPLFLITGASLLLRSCLFFDASTAVYVGFVITVVLRPSIVAVGLVFIRNRFPAEHFNRIAGVQSSSVSSLCFFQYFLFVWIQNNFLAAMLFFLCILSFTFLHPLHLLSKTYIRKITKKHFEYISQKENTTLVKQKTTLEDGKVLEDDLEANIT